MAGTPNGNATHEEKKAPTNGKSSVVNWPYVGEPPVYAPLSPWTRFQGGGFYVMLFTVFGICWTILCAAGAYYGMRNVAIVNKIGIWEAVKLRSTTGLWLWIQVWLYPVLSTQTASVLIRLYYKRKGKPLVQSLTPGRVKAGKE